jgi:hypothetical protein
MISASLHAFGKRLSYQCFRRRHLETGGAASGQRVKLESDDLMMDDIDLFNVRGGDGGALELPGDLWSRPRAATKPARKQTFYHQRIKFRLPNDSTVNLIVVITTRKKWEKKMRDKTGWTVVPFLKNWVVVLQLVA